MHEAGTNSRATIPEEVMLARLAQSEQMREFFIEMWKQNPALAKQGGARVQSLLTPATDEWLPETSAHKQRGISLIELLMFIVIVSAALAGIMMAMNFTAKGSSDPLVRKQAIAAVYSLLEEIELQDFISASTASATCPHNQVTQANRASDYHIICDYNGFATSGIYSLDDAAAVSAVLSGYNASVTVTPEAAAWNGIAAGNAVRIDVTVNTSDNRESITATGYRTAY